jgi:Ca2+-binding RTX toxin-like protein
VTVFGGDGNDYFEQDDLGARVFAQGGNDTINVLSREANYAGLIDGGAGVDLIIGAGGNRDLLDLREYARVENASMDDFAGTVIGTEGANRIDATGSDAVTLIGLGGADTLIGGGQNDSLVGGWGNDSIDGGEGSDIADGGPGANTIVNVETQPGPGSIGRVGRTLIADGSWGQDEITIDRVGGDNVIVRVNEMAREFDMDDFDEVLLRGNNGFDVLRIRDPLIAGSLVRPVTLLGGNGNDQLIGSDGATSEVLNGGANPDFLDSRDGFGGDVVIGGAGNDHAFADPGDDVSEVEEMN